MQLGYIPFVDLTLSRLLHDRMAAVHAYHAAWMQDASLDEANRWRHRKRALMAFPVMAITGIHHLQSIVLRADCTFDRLERAQADYLTSLGVDGPQLTYIHERLRRASQILTEDGSLLPDRALFGVN